MGELESSISRLAANARSIAALFQDMSDEQARWRPAAGSWSMLEVICHLYDEEREDFRSLLDVLLHHRPDAVRPIHPQRWVTERNYQGQDPQTALADFLAEREHSLAWLAGLKQPDWARTLTLRPGLTQSAGEMLACWIAHDFLHLRQLVELHYTYHAQNVRPYSVEYAGEW